MKSQSDITNCIMLQIGKGSPSACDRCSGHKHFDHVNHPTPSENKQFTTLKYARGNVYKVSRIHTKHWFIDLLWIYMETQTDHMFCSVTFSCEEINNYSNIRTTFYLLVQVLTIAVIRLASIRLLYLTSLNPLLQLLNKTGIGKIMSVALDTHMWSWSWEPGNKQTGINPSGKRKPSFLGKKQKTKNSTCLRSRLLALEQK